MERPTTTDDASGLVARSAKEFAPGLGLVVAWYREDPTRIGDLIFVPHGDERVVVFGRGSDPEADVVRAALVRQRPGVTAPTAPLSDRRLSWKQLRIQRVDDASLAVENIGRRALAVRGKETRQAVVRAGDVIAVAGVVVFVVVERPPCLPALLHLSADALHAFGEPDPFGIVGESLAAWQLREAIAFARRGLGHALIAGASGSGKDLAARAVGGSGVAVLGLAEVRADEVRSALLAIAARPGIEAVIIDGLDEAPDNAAQLARLMHDGHGLELTRGTSAPLRVVATAVSGVFSPSIHVRFRHVITVPSLAARREDIPLIAMQIARRELAAHTDLNARFTGPDGAPRLSPELMALLASRPMGGGTRANAAALWRGIGVSAGEQIEAPVGVEGPGPDSDEFVVGKRSAHFGDASPEADDDEGDGLEDDGLAELDPGPLLRVADLPSSVTQGIANLTRTERLVVQHVALNRTSRQIARALFVSVRTIQNHRARICKKLGLEGHNRLLATAMALRTLLGPPPAG